MKAFNLVIFFGYLIYSLGAATHSEKPVNPVLLVPGVGGSVLQIPGSTQDLWVSLDAFLISLPAIAWAEYDLPQGPFFVGTDNDFRTFGLGKYRGNGEIGPFFSDVEIEVPYALREEEEPSCRLNKKSGGLCGVEFVVDFANTPWQGPFNEAVDLFTEYASFNNYAAFVRYLQLEKNLIPGENLFGFPYDWRHSIRRPAMLQRLDETLKQITKDGMFPASILSHSMGCLVVKSYISAYPKNAEKYIKNWVAVGGPFQGAGGEILSAFFKGYMIGNISICDCTARQLAVQSPAIMEMMPQSEYVLPPLEVHVTTNTQTTTTSGTDAVLDLIQGAYARHIFSYDGKDYAWPLSLEAREWAHQTRLLLRDAPIPSQIKIYAVYGDKLNSPFSGTLNMKDGYTPGDLICESDGCKQDSCLQSADKCALNFSYLPGDGTVVGESAAHPYGPANYNNLHRHAVPGVEHQELIKPSSGMYDSYARWLGLDH